MKKLIAVIIIMVMIFGVSGCGKKNNTEFAEATPTTTEAVTAESTAEEDTTEETTAETTTEKKEKDTTKSTTKSSNNKNKSDGKPAADNTPKIDVPKDSESGNLKPQKEEKPVDTPDTTVVNDTTAPQKQPAGDILEPVSMDLYEDEETGDLLIKLVVKNPTSFSYKPLEFEVAFYNASNTLLDTFYYDFNDGIKPNSTETFWLVVEKSEAIFNSIEYVSVTDVYEYEV